jgi:hypothetical protein
VYDPFSGGFPGRYVPGIFLVPANSRIIYVMTGNPCTEQEMRKTSDLIDEMLAEAKKTWLVAIAVGFEGKTEFVFSSQRHPLEELNRLVKNGGSPIGLLRFDRENSAIQGSYRPFAEYENEEWAKKYLAGLLDNTEEIVGMGQEPTFGLPKAY